jgi:hypothetical protein
VNCIIVNLLIYLAIKPSHGEELLEISRRKTEICSGNNGVLLAFTNSERKNCLKSWNVENIQYTDYVHQCSQFCPLPFPLELACPRVGSIIVVDGQLVFFSIVLGSFFLTGKQLYPFQQLPSEEFSSLTSKKCKPQRCFCLHRKRRGEPGNHLNVRDDTNLLCSRQPCYWHPVY